MLNKLMSLLKMKCMHSPVTRSIYTGKYSRPQKGYKTHNHKTPIIFGDRVTQSTVMYEVKVVKLCKKCNIVLSETFKMVPIKGVKNAPYRG